MSGSNLHIAWARLFLRAAAAAGVTDVILSPGSRSTPLVVAAAESAELRVHVIVDERSAAFFALGQARVTGRPSLLFCTSGTAGAHYLPALIEAHQSFVPMIAVTADRPWELMDAAAPQTIDQVKLFGDFARWFIDVGVPDPAPSALRALPRVAAQAVLRARGPIPGPVHINMHFRKPLEPVPVSGEEAWEPLWRALMDHGAPDATLPALTPDERAIASVVERCQRAERGLIVCGPAPLATAERRAAILELARRTGFPLLAEATSQLRFGGDREGVVACSHFDAILRARAFRARHAPDLILQIGAPPTSTGYAAFIAEHPDAPRVVIAPQGWNDPNSSAAALIFADPADLAERVAARLERPVERPSWAASFARADEIALAAAERALGGDASTLASTLAPTLTEGVVARAVVRACPEGSILVVGNSTPVRDLDAYCPASARALRVLHQRGASGIDGLVSGAAGAHAASGAPVTLLLGDVSLLHDLTALGLLRDVEGPLVVVVVQNGGGRIFEQLPIYDCLDRDRFERYFATPQPVRFDHAAAAFGLRFARAETPAALAAALAEAHGKTGATLIEAVTPPGEGTRQAKAMWAELAARLVDDTRDSP